MPISEVNVHEALQALCDSALLIDVREPDEHALGIPRGAVLAPRAQLEASPEKYISNKSQTVYLICAAGGRSMLAAQSLHAQGYSTISVSGGFNAWREANLPVDVGISADQQDFYQRYARHLRLPKVGVQGQQRLNQAKVVVVGAGGLGSPVLFYLAAAGIGQITIIDGDVIDRSNLQRQILHKDHDVGSSKAESAARALQALNPTINIIICRDYLSVSNAELLIKGSDVVVDATDNFEARYLLSDTCHRLQIPWVYAAIHRFEGQLSVFDSRQQSTVRACYRCLFPQEPDAENAPNCAEAGVLGVLPGVMGSLQANEVIKLILDIGERTSGRLLHFDALSMKFFESRFSYDSNCICRLL
jgi:sulfur-carrier protein adenylyltransferase/sulfurtransferase